MKTLPLILIAALLALSTGHDWAAEVPHVASPSRATPALTLPLASLRGDADAVRQLIRAGADLNKKDAHGSTPLIVATTFGHGEVARLLIEAGADLRIGNDEGSTPLHIAAFLARTDIVLMLLDHGADRYARNHLRHTPFDTVSLPFDDVKDTYELLAAALAPLGLRLDFGRIRAARPAVARILRPRPEDLATVRYRPMPRQGGWPVSSPAAQGLDPATLATLYFNARQVQTLYGLLVIRHGHLVAEGYFNQGGADQLSGRQSMTKSVVSAMVGKALESGCLSSVDQHMLDFFPELADRVTDPRKRQITVRELLQMRAGYPWEGITPPYFDRLFMQGQWHWLPHIVDFPLVAAPGTAFGYSNLTSHLLAVIVARACGKDLQAFSQSALFAPIGARVPRWTSDPDGYRWGWGEIYLTARDMARFGQLYLDRGRHKGRQVIGADWVQQSLQRYSQGVNITGRTGSAAGLYFRDLGYGYQWWSARSGRHHFDYAWGHGGQLVVLLPSLDMVIVTTADPLHHLPESKGWPYEMQVLDLVGRFINDLPSDESARTN